MARVLVFNAASRRIMVAEGFPGPPEWLEIQYTRIQGPDKHNLKQFG